MKLILIFFTFSLFFQSTHASNVDAIYRNDNRQFITSYTNPQIREISKSIGLIINKDELVDNFIIAHKLTDPNRLNICSDERFAESLSVESCTGFLIAPDLVATAGHCFMSNYDCDKRAVVFGVTEESSTKDGHNISPKNVYQCKEIVTKFYTGNPADDFAIIRLDRKASKIKSLKLRQKGAININEKVFMLGHPLGMPMMISKVARVRDNSDEVVFRADLDSFKGNSGSPVFNKETLEVEGILVGGQEDFILDQIQNCNRYQTYNPTSKTNIKGEDVMRIKAISDLVPSIR